MIYDQRGWMDKYYKYYKVEEFLIIFKSFNCKNAIKIKKKDEERIFHANNVWIF